MTQTLDWDGIIATESHLSPDAARQLRDIGFVVVPGPVILGGCEQLSDAFDRAMTMADPADVRTAQRFFDARR